MATITIKNVPDDLYELLKARAQANRRSINNEAIMCIERAVRSHRPDVERVLAEAKMIREKTADYLTTHDEFNQIKNEGRS